MSSTRLLLAAILSVVPSLVTAQSSGQARDESLAREFIYCALVAQYWTEVFSRLERRDEASARAAQRQRNFLYLAAAMKSDGDFLEKERPLAVAKMEKKLAEQRTTGNTAIMDNEARHCTLIFKTKVVPILQPYMPK